jgi:Ferritin-like
MNIADGLIVPRGKCSIELVKTIFMKIEEPEKPLVLKGAMLQAPEYNTIGEFYDAIKDKLTELVEKGVPVFTGDFEREMVNNSWFPADQLFRIDGLDSAKAAIDVIILQGEGTSISPVDPQNAAAHYYRFEQIVRGKQLVADAAAPNGYSFTGAPVTLDERNVLNMQPNPDPDTLPEGSRARRLATEFAGSYTRLLNALHQTFNGQPGRFDAATGLMYEMRLLAQEVLAVPVPGSDPALDLRTGLSFRYQPLGA